MTARTRVPEGVMAWQERLWELIERAGNWPEQMLEMVCMLAALPFYLGGVYHGYFPFFFMGAAFTAVAWLAEEKRLGGEPKLLKRLGSILKRCIVRPWWTVTAVALMLLGLWREAVWMAILGIVVLRGGVRRASKIKSSPSD